MINQINEVNQISIWTTEGKAVRWVPARGLAYVSGEDGSVELPVVPPGCFSAAELNGSWAMLP